MILDKLINLILNPTIAHAADSDCPSLKNLIILGYNFGHNPCGLTFVSIIGFVLYLGRNLLGLATFIAIIYIVYGAIIYIGSAGNEDQARKGRTSLTYAIIGFVVAMLAFVIVNTFLKYVTDLDLSKIPQA